MGKELTSRATICPNDSVPLDFYEIASELFRSCATIANEHEHDVYSRIDAANTRDVENFERVHDGARPPSGGDIDMRKCEPAMHPPRILDT